MTEALNALPPVSGALYSRVSTDDQLEYSIDAQIKAIMAYAENNGIAVSGQHIYIDEGISGKTAEKRPAFMRMIAAAKTKPRPFEVILVHRLDRFARSREDSVVYKSLLRRECGIRVLSVTEPIEDDKFSVILEAMLEAMAEYYSLNLSDEVKKGMTEKAQRGEFQTKAPFGYDNDVANKRLVENPREAQVVRLIFERFASGEMTMRQIAMRLNDLGIRTKRGNRFENRTVDYILNNPVYIGMARWKPNGRFKRNWHDPEIILRESQHKAIVDAETWRRAQGIIKENKELYPRRARSAAKIHSWVNGLVFCGNCGKALVNCRDQYLQCNGYSKGLCKISCNIKYSLIENAVLEELEGSFPDEIVIENPSDAPNAKADPEYNVTVNRLEQLKGRLERLREAYQAGVDSLEEYRAGRALLEQEREKLLAHLEFLEKPPAPEPAPPRRRRIKSAWALLTDEDTDLETKHRAAHFLIGRITYTRQEHLLEIEYRQA